jgi:hypothetical protein
VSVAPDGSPVDVYLALSSQYTLGGRSWEQHFEAAIVDDAELAALAAETDLRIECTLDDAAAWVVLRRMSAWLRS